MNEKSTIHAKQSEYLRAWLQEWSLCRQIERADECGGDSESFRPVKAPQRGEMLAIRQVRLLYPDCRITWNRPIYAAVIDKVEGGAYLAAPFSRFSAPALPGELLTARADPQFKVLCLWNTFEIAEARLLAGWHVDSLENEELEDALDLRRCIREKTPVSERLRARTGPSVVNPDDPRWEYQEEELEMIEQLSLEAPGYCSTTIYEINEMPAAYRSKAAESDDNEPI